MKIVVLSQWYPPEPQSVVSELAETLAADGHDVTVLTGFPNFPSGKLYPGYRLTFVRRETWNGIPIVRVPLFPYHGRSPLLRVVNLASFCAAAMLIGPWFVRRPNLVHAIQPPTTCVPAWVLSRLWRVPFTYEVQDLWPDTLRATGMVSAGRALRLVDRYCAWAYRKTAAIRVISEGFRTALVSRGVPDSKVHLLPNWVDTDRYAPPDRSAPKPAWDTTRAAFNIVYAGNLGLAQGLDNLLEAAARIPAAARVHVVLIGDGVDAGALRQKAATRQLSNVEFVPFQTPDGMPAILAAADALLLHLKRDPLFSMTIPHKLLTYLAAGRPILACADGEAAAIVRRANAGVVCAPGDPAALAAAAMALATLSPAERAAMGRNGRACACAEFERTAVVPRIGRMLEDAAFPAKFFRIDAAPATAPRPLPEGYRLTIWRAGAGRAVPPGCRGAKWWVWALFHRARIFRSDRYGAVLIFRGDRLVHRSPLFPKYSRFPFMRDDDLQVGDTWTDPEERGQGLAAIALGAAAREALEPGARLWYLTTADNASSIRAALSAGLAPVGHGIRTSRFGLRLFGAFRMSGEAAR